MQDSEPMVGAGLKPAPTDIRTKVRKSLTYSILDGTGAATTNGIVDNYIRPFAIALNATNFHIGLLGTFSYLLTALAQLKNPDITEKVGSRKKMVVLTVFLQALMLLPIGLIPFLLSTPGVRITALIAFYSLYLLFGASSGPPWGSLMANLVPERLRGVYFGRRDRVIGFASLTSCFVAGGFLHLFTERILTAFMVIFFFGTVSRLISCSYLTRHYEPPLILKKEHYFTFFEFLKRARVGNFGKYALFVASFNFSVHIAAPFFSVYMLRDLQLSYLTYTILCTTPAVSGLLTKTFWGRRADRFGNLSVLRICASIIPILPLVWIFSQNVYYLFIIEVASGIVWGGFNLCSLNFVYDSSIPEKRTRVISYYSVVNCLAVGCGTFVGGILATNLPDFLGNKLLLLFLISAILRGIVVIAILPRVKEVRTVEMSWETKISFKIIEQLFQLIPLKRTRILSQMTESKKEKPKPASEK
ncbi:MAG: MFS transporter [Planctomycetes bacterium]|nr:MFS transporter [Planctomycetota bacterium]